MTIKIYANETSGLTLTETVPKSSSSTTLSIPPLDVGLLTEKRFNNKIHMSVTFCFNRKNQLLERLPYY